MTNVMANLVLDSRDPMPSKIYIKCFDLEKVKKKRRAKYDRNGDFL